MTTTAPSKAQQLPVKTNHNQQISLIERCLYGEYNYQIEIIQDNKPNSANLAKSSNAVHINTNDDYDPLLHPPPNTNTNTNTNTANDFSLENQGGGIAQLAHKFEYLHVDDVSTNLHSHTSTNDSKNHNNNSIRTRMERVWNIDHTIDLVELRRLAAKSGGIMDDDVITVTTNHAHTKQYSHSHRAVAWRVLLGYLPPQLKLWKETLTRERLLYRQLLQELFLPMTSSAANLAHTNVSSRDQDIPAGLREQLRRSGRETLLDINNDPDLNCLNLNSVSSVTDDVIVPPRHCDGDNDNTCNWSSFIDNAMLLDEIRKDVIRTHPALSFYLEPTDNLGKR